MTARPARSPCSPPTRRRSRPAVARPRAAPRAPIPARAPAPRQHVGAVPASTSIPHEGAGTEVVVVAPGSRTECPTASFSCLGNFVPDKTLAQAGTSFTINEAHKSSGSVAPAAAPTITGLLPVAPVGNGGTTPLTVNGTNFRPDQRSEHRRRAVSDAVQQRHAAQGHQRAQAHERRQHGDHGHDRCHHNRRNQLGVLMSKEPTKRTDDDDYDYGEPRSAKEAPAATGTSPEDVPSINEPPGSAVFPPGYGPGEGQPPPEQLPPLVLTDIDPDSVPAGSGTFVLTVTGEGFDSNTLIVFNDEEMATTFVSATQSHVGPHAHLGRGRSGPCRTTARRRPVRRAHLRVHRHRSRGPANRSQLEAAVKRLSSDKKKRLWSPWALCSSRVGVRAAARRWSLETMSGLPVSEAANGRGVPVTKVIGKAGLPVQDVPTDLGWRRQCLFSHDVCGRPPHAFSRDRVNVQQREFHQATGMGIDKTDATGNASSLTLFGLLNPIEYQARCRCCPQTGPGWASGHMLEVFLPMSEVVIPAASVSSPEQSTRISGTMEQTPTQALALQPSRTFWAGARPDCAMCLAARKNGTWNADAGASPATGVNGRFWWQGLFPPRLNSPTPGRPMLSPGISVNRLLRLPHRPDFPSDGAHERARRADRDRAWALAGEAAEFPAGQVDVTETLRDFRLHGANRAG